MSAKYLKTFFEEKDIDRDQRFEVESDVEHPSYGKHHSMTYGVVIDAIMGAPANEQKGIADMLRRIDFQNGDVKHYLRHLAKALAERFNKGG